MDCQYEEVKPISSEEHEQDTVGDNHKDVHLLL